jgi:hypothetical protein
MYEQKNSQTATLYGRAMSSIEARGIVSEIAAIAERIDRAVVESHDDGLSDDQRRAELRAYWESLFGRDLDSVLALIAKYHFHDTPQAQGPAELWKRDLAGRTNELLMFGFLEDPEFLTRAMTTSIG